MATAKEELLLAKAVREKEQLLLKKAQSEAC